MWIWKVMWQPDQPTNRPIQTTQKNCVKIHCSKNNASLDKILDSTLTTKCVLCVPFDIQLVNLMHKLLHLLLQFCCCVFFVLFVSALRVYMCIYAHTLRNVIWNACIPTKHMHYVYYLFGCVFFFGRRYYCWWCCCCYCIWNDEMLKKMFKCYISWKSTRVPKYHENEEI